MNSLKTEKEDIDTRVEHALKSIRPYLIKDGGDVRVLKITKNRNLILEFVGNCRDCPMSEMTFRAGVEQTIKSAVPEIRTIKIT